MTRKEQIKQAALAEYCNDPSITFVLVCGAFEQGAEWADKTMLEKACKWLENNYEDIGIRWMRGYTIDDFVEQFKQEMKEL